MSDTRPRTVVATRSHHLCPGGCGRTVANRLYACGPCWRALPADLKRAIHATAHDPLLSPARTAAFGGAAAFYAARRPRPHPGTADQHTTGFPADRPHAPRARRSHDD